MRISERFAVVPLISPADLQSAGYTSESINMGKLHSIAFILQFGAITGNDTLVQFYAGATDGAVTTELAFKYRLSEADAKVAGGDQYGDATAIAAGGSGLAFASAASFSDRTIIVEFDSADMPEGMPWITCVVDDGSASVLLAGGVAIGVPRFEANDVPTVI